MKKLITIILITVFFNTAFAEVKTIYHGNGEKRYEVNYKDGTSIEHGLKTWWYENGQKKAEINYKDGKKHDLFTKWWNDGQKRSESCYQNGKHAYMSYCR